MRTRTCCVVPAPSVITALLFSLFVLSPLRSAWAQLPTLGDVSRNDVAPAAGPLPAWEAATVKPHTAGDRTMSWQMTGDSMVLKNFSLEFLVCNAWNLKNYQISGLTGWTTGKTFDLTAKVSEEDLTAYKRLSDSQRREMLQHLLIERFHLAVHMESKILPLYDLTVDRNGAKLPVTTAIEAPSAEEARAHPEKYRKGSMLMSPGKYEATGVPVRALASQLENALGKTVDDKTELRGLYDISLHYRPEETGTDSSDLPSLFAAVQEQLGLKLVPDKGPVPILVVESVQQPDAN